MAASAHPYKSLRLGLATMHGKERAIAPPFRRVIGAEVVVAPNLDTDELGTFSGEVPRPDALVETALLKAEMVFRGSDVDCALASEGSYGPIDRLPLKTMREAAFDGRLGAAVALDPQLVASGEKNFYLK